MDEKSFKRGHSYITLLTDLEASRVLEVVEERTIGGGGPVVGDADTGTEVGGGSGGGGHVGAVHSDDPKAGAGGGHRA